MKSILRRVSALSVILLIGVVTLLAQTSNYFNGFEGTVSSGDWGSTVIRSSGFNGIPASAGSYYGETGTDFTRFGGYNYLFPAWGFKTSIDIYLNVDGGYANDKRFDYTCAISSLSGHRRDFIFNGGFYNDNVAPGSGNRFVFSASNNTPGWPKNPGRSPIVIATTGWYTFEHHFYDNGSGVLAVDLNIYSGNTPVATWTISDASDIIGTTVGGNRYGWFPMNQLGALAIDNSALTITPPPCNISASAGSDATVYYGYAPLASTQLQATATGGTGAVSYSWSPTTGLDNPLISNPVASPSTTTTYVVTATDENLCSSTDEVTVSVVDVRCGNKLDKVAIYHRNGKGIYSLICVAASAIPSHLAHGDVFVDPLSKSGIAEAETPAQFALGQNYPNPFNPVTTIRFAVPVSAPVVIAVYNTLGQQVAELVNRQMEAGYHEVEFDAGKLGSGIYMYRMSAGKYSEVRKLILVK